MIERKIREGMILDFPLPGYAGYANDVELMQPVPKLLCHVWRKGHAKKQRGVATGGLHKQGHRNFAWLPWRPNFTTFTALDGADVLSGPFSGCRMLLLEHNGVAQVHHVGTSEETAKNLILKRAFHAYLSGPEVAFRRCWSPYGDFKDDMPPASEGEGVSRVLGLVTADGDAFSIFLWKQGDVFTQTRAWRVARVTEAASVSRQEALDFFDV